MTPRRRDASASSESPTPSSSTRELNNPVPDGLYDPALDPSTRTARAPRAASAPCTARATSATSNSPSLSTTRAPSAPSSASFAPLPALPPLQDGERSPPPPPESSSSSAPAISRRPPPSPSAASAKPSAQELNELAQEVGDIDLRLDTTHASRVLPVANRGRPEDRQRWSAAMAESRDLLKAFLAGVPVKCENCGCASPKINPEGANKIYRQGLTGKQRETNAGLGIDLEMSLAAPPRRTVKARTARSSRGRRWSRTPPLARKKRKKKRGDGSEDGSGPTGFSRRRGSGSDSRRRRRLRLGGRRRRRREKEKEGVVFDGRIRRRCDRAPGRQVYVTPIEARALLKKLWNAEYDFCSMVWVANALRVQPSPLPRRARPRRPSDEATPRGSSCRRYW